MAMNPYRHRIAKVLLALDGVWLAHAACYLAGGTALMLQLGGYRETRGIDFLCGSQAGFRRLRTAVSQPNLGGLLKASPLNVCGTHCSHNQIEVFLAVDGLPVRIVFMSAHAVHGYRVQAGLFDVPLLSRKDMYVSKLLANTDRGLDEANHYRDVIDLAMMVDTWGPVPPEAWRDATLVYGGEVAKVLMATCGLMQDRVRVIHHLWALAMYTSLVDSVCANAASLCDAYRTSMLSAVGNGVDHAHAVERKTIGGTA